MVHSKKLSISQTIWQQMPRISMNDKWEWMRKQAIIRSTVHASAWRDCGKPQKPSIKDMKQ
jgi:hypothetical protein